MSIVPVSCLAASDLTLLGNNLLPGGRRRRRPSSQVCAVNRSLAGHGERVSRLYAIAGRRPPVRLPQN